MAMVTMRGALPPAFAPLLPSIRHGFSHFSYGFYRTKLQKAQVLNQSSLSLDSPESQSGLNGFLTFLASFLPARVAMALDYDEIIKGAEVSPPIEAGAGIDLEVVNSVVNFANENPAAIIGGVFAVLVPLVLSRIFGGGKSENWGIVSAKDAYAKLGDSALQASLLDVRDAQDVKTEGTPDLRSYKKKPIQISYSGEDVAFVEKVKAKFKEPASTILYVLDRFDGNSSSIAKSLASNGFKEVYAIKGGAEAPNGWRNSDLPWLLPRKAFSLNFDSIFQTDSFSLGPTLGLAAAAGAGVVVFSEAETALQLVGTVALLQIFVKKFLFAEDRKRTLKELQELLDTKIAPKELVEEIKSVVQPILPKLEATKVEEEPVKEMQAIVEEPKTYSEPVEVAAVEEAPVEAPVYPDLKPPSSPTPSRPMAYSEPVEVAAVEEAPIEAPVVAAVEEAPVVSAQAPVEEPALVTPKENGAALPSTPRPLSPYAMYPDLKPPSSPTPSRPC